MKPEDTMAYLSTSGYWVTSANGKTRAQFYGDDAQQYAEEHAQVLRDKLPKPRWTVDRQGCHVVMGLDDTILLPVPAQPHAQKIADLLNELEL